MRTTQKLVALLGAFASATPYSNHFGVPGKNATFDYVVVGRGTAGLTVAARLAECGRFSVAVVEAGGFYQQDNGNLSIVPGFASFFTGAAPNDTNPLIDWGFVTTPQAGANNRTLHYARGKTLGGSSARNYMVYHRPTIGSMQLWANQVGDESYTWEAVKPFYEKSASFNARNQCIQPNASNDQAEDQLFEGGPLKVSYPNHVDSFGKWARHALINLGLVAINGFNNGSLLGSAWVTWTIDQKNAHRSSSESSFLREAVLSGRPLTIYNNTLAQKILFDWDNTVNSVAVSSVSSDGTTFEDYVLEVNKEVIVSAGAFQSPQLLMASGIGPEDLLRQNGI